MPFSRDTYTSAGEATYTITYPYLAEADIELFVDGVTKAFTFDDSTTARPTVAVTTGQVVLIVRDSTREARLANYVDASVFKADTLDNDILQAFYVSQEALDLSDLRLGLTAAGTNWDGESKKITLVTDGTGAQDVTTLTQVQTLIGAAVGLRDLNGFEMILDADADTSLTADTDDQIDVKIAGADDFRFLANIFRAISGSSVETNTINETTAASGVTIDGLLIKDSTLPAGVGVGTAGTEGTLHVHTATAGAITANTSGDDLIVEGSGDTGISILCPDANLGLLAFGSPSDNKGCYVEWDLTNDLMTLGAHNAGADVSIVTGSDVEAMRLLSTGFVGINTATPDGHLHVHRATAGTVTAHGNADDLVVENSGNAGITILSPDANDSSLFFGSASDNRAAMITWNTDASLMTIGTDRGGDSVAFISANSVEAMRINSDQDVHIGGAAPLARFHVTDSVTTAIGLIESTNAGAGVSPTLGLWRNSATPADADRGGNLVFYGNTDDGAGGLTSSEVQYAAIDAQFVETTDTNEHGLIRFRTSTAGSLTSVVNIAQGVYTAGETDQGADTINATTLYEGGVALSSIYAPVGGNDPVNTAVTDMATGTPATITIGSIPSWVTEILINISAMSANTGTTDPRLRLGDAGGIETTGYTSQGGGDAASGVTSVSSTGSFIIHSTPVAASGIDAHIRLTLLDSATNLWVESHIASLAPTGGTHFLSVGTKALSGVLTQLTVDNGGTNTFDAGAINIRYS